MVMDLGKLDLDTQFGMRKDNIVVAIWMVTYNHENYIKQAVESVMNQKTDFQFKLFIGEDFSTDKTKEICIALQNKYSEKIKLFIQNKNIGANNNAMQIYKACLESGAKYIAMCEGDDFWTDPLKLEKQVDILEKNEQIGLVYSNYRIVDANCNILEEQKYSSKMPSGNIISELIKGQFPWTLTVCFRSNLLKGFEDLIFNPRYHMGDFPLWLHLGLRHQFKYLDCVTASYRRNEGSITDSNRSYLKKVDFIYSWNNILKDFIREKEVTDIKLLNQINKLIQLKLLSAFRHCLRNHDYLKASEIWTDANKMKLPIPFKYYVLYITQFLGGFGKWLVNSYYKKLN